jgi:DNA ligase (NAD+)
VNYFRECRNRKVIEKLKKHLKIPAAERTKAKGGGALAGKTLVLTGTLPTYSRDEALLGLTHNSMTGP